jgi:hypothetical protein
MGENHETGVERDAAHWIRGDQDFFIECIESLSTHTHLVDWNALQDFGQFVKVDPVDHPPVHK